MNTVDAKQTVSGIKLTVNKAKLVELNREQIEAAAFDANTAPLCSISVILKTTSRGTCTTF